MRDLHSSKPNPGKVSRQTKIFKGEYKKQLENRAIIVGCHCDTENKMKMTEELLEKIRKKYDDKICLIVASHLSVSEKIQNLGDYVILNKNNPIINLDLFTTKSYNNLISNTIYRANGKTDVISKLKYNHSYAHHLLIRDAYSLCSVNEIDYVHFMNYDVPDKCLSEIDWHFQKMFIENFDGVFYKYYYEKFYSTEFFSLTSNSFKFHLEPIRSFEQWIYYNTIDTEQNYKLFLENANIYCDSIFEKDVSDVIGKVNYSSEVNRFGTVSLLNHIVGNFTVIPYKKDNTIIINNSFTGYGDEKSRKNIKWESYDESMNFINTFDSDVDRNNWVDYICPDDCKYVKIYIDSEIKAFFDITDKRNIGKIV